MPSAIEPSKIMNVQSKAIKLQKKMKNEKREQYCKCGIYRQQECKLKKVEKDRVIKSERSKEEKRVAKRRKRR